LSIAKPQLLRVGVDLGVEKASATAWNRDDDTIRFRLYGTIVALISPAKLNIS